MNVMIWVSNGSVGICVKPLVPGSGDIPLQRPESAPDTRRIDCLFSNIFGPTKENINTLSASLALVGGTDHKGHLWLIVRQKYTKACFEVYTMFYCWSCYTMVQKPPGDKLSHLGKIFIHGFLFLVWHKWQFSSLWRENSILCTCTIMFRMLAMKTHSKILFKLYIAFTYHYMATNSWLRPRLM